MYACYHDFHSTSLPREVAIRITARVLFTTLVLYLRLPRNGCDRRWDCVLLVIRPACDISEQESTNGTHKYARAADSI